MIEKSFFGLNPNGFHKIVYSEWGDSNNPHVILCVHGLTRNRHDFDWLAESLSTEYRVICPDIVGRGDSDYFEDPSLYSYPQYLSDLNVLLARINAEKLTWIGTAFGGILGMMMASYKPSPINSLILNDVGSVVSSMGLKRISQFAPNPGVFQSMDAASSYFQKNHLQGIGPVSDEIWNKLLENSLRWSESQRVWKATYDPAVFESFCQDQKFHDIDLTAYWKEVICPTFIIRGAQSDMLMAEITQKMVASKKNVQAVEVPKTGHFPSLTTSNQFKLVRDWLHKTRAL